MTLRRIGLPCVLSPPALPHGLRQNTRPSGYAGVVALRFASMCSSGDEIVRSLALAIIRHPMDIAQSGVDILMAEQPVHGQPGFELVGRIGVAQTVNAADFPHSRARLGVGEGPLDRSLA